MGALTVDPEPDSGQEWDDLVRIREETDAPARAARRGRRRRPPPPPGGWRAGSEHQSPITRF
ncbi:hypothetical protein ACFXPY_15995, partial [Streptomyces sp. NPDC059153]